MSAPPPILTVFTGEGFTVLPRHVELARQHYGEGEIVPLVRHEERSRKSHDHYFVMVNEAWENLPEEMARRWPSSEHLRKWALIKAGYHDETSFVASSKAEALRLRVFVAQVSDDYAVVIARESVVVRYTAKSQSMRAMGKADFQKSKDDVLGILADLLSVQPAELRQNAGQAA